MLQILATLAVLIASPSPGPEAVRQATERAYGQTEVQRELPTTELPKSTVRGRDRLRRPARQRRREQTPLGAIRSMLLWVLTFVLAGVLAMWLVREFLGYVPDAEAELEARALEGGPQTTVVSAPLQDARQLAQQELFGQAIHALLLRTLMELSKSRAQPLAPSLTSREILDALELPRSEHDALTGLIEAVEFFHFRGTTPGRDDYSRCLEHFEVFAKAYVQERA